MTTRNEQLTEVFVEVADSLIDDFDVIDFLQNLSVRCVELLDVAAVGILLADESDRLHVLAASDEHTRLLELFALQHDQGPCVECYRDGRPRVGVTLTDPEAATRWPQFARSAQDTGFVATNALPLRLRGRVIGALSLFQRNPEPLAAQDLSLAQALADVATIAILQQRTLAHSEAERDQLQYALNSRIVIEQVKGILAERWQMAIDESFSIFRAYARAHSRKLSDLARAIADGTQDTDTIRAFSAHRPWPRA
ncbi:GAF and ANTAR domain-containing protein [Streptomyces fructofermentans]|uniref:Transcriptional regulator n=1 Tax=Streptomyces fructofermentans TaxID=152141 RepID=A0A918NN07_9ACTN|nr:GAF and ANTAR domain-containing protein [Streptomyces fructofermentans]GGX81382.1 transcriptional regulator [Streptomyces fructofermentans]